ncbi:MAG: hypothetical protein KDK66_04180 [Deltaproteobacteria bacterium]|nr:hypothetical protein [Deltaproteobacteria bacterium]
MSFRLKVFLFFILLSFPLRAGEAQKVEVKDLNFSIQKPADWYFFQDLKAPLTKEKFSIGDLLSHYGKTPVVALSKFPSDYLKDINPNVRVTLKSVDTTDPKKSVAAKDPELLLRGMIKSLESLLPDFKLEEEARAIDFSGNHGAFARMSYQMQLVQQGQTRANSSLWLVMPRADYAFLISAVSRQDETNAKRADLEEIVKTIKIQALKD